jgi:hypothetical protein
MCELLNVDKTLTVPDLKLAADQGNADAQRLCRPVLKERSNHRPRW